MTVWLPAPIEDEIRAHGRASYPEECCGVLIGTEDRTHGDTVKDVRVDVVESRRMDNVKDGERDRRYIIDPLTLVALEDELDEGPYRIVGIYHSHPDHPAAPSEFDRVHALPGWSYAILRVADGTDETLTSWRLSADRATFHEEPIESLSPDM